MGSKNEESEEYTQTIFPLTLNMARVFLSFRLISAVSVMEMQFDQNGTNYEFTFADTQEQPECNSANMIDICMKDVQKLGCMQVCKTRVAQLSYGMDGVNELELIKTPINCDELCDLGKQIMDPLTDIDTDRIKMDPMAEIEPTSQKEIGRSVADLMQETAMLDFIYTNGMGARSEIISRVCEIMVEVTKGCGTWPAGGYKRMKAKALQDTILFPSVLTFE